MAKVRGGHQSRVRWGCLTPHPKCPHGSELPLEGSSEEPSPWDSLSWAAVPRSAWLPLQGCHVLGGPDSSLVVTAGQVRLEARAPCPMLGRSSQGPFGLFVLVTRPCPRAEGSASLLGGSAWAPTPGRASVQPELWPARSHTGTAAKETWSRAAPRIPTHMCSPAHTEITPLQAIVNIYRLGARFSQAPGSEALG